MAKIVTPRLPEATEEYSREQVSQLIQTLDQVIFVLNNTYFLSLLIATHLLGPKIPF